MNPIQAILYYAKRILVFGIILTETLGFSAESKIKSIDLHGTGTFDDREIQNAIQIYPGSALPVAWSGKIQKNLTDWYYRNDFFWMQIDSIQTRFTPDSQFVSLVIWIDEGPRTRLGHIQMESNKPGRNAEYLEILDLNNDEFRQNELELAIERLLIFAENNGFPLMEVSIRDIVFHDTQDGPEIDIHLSVQSGPIVSVDAVNVKGNSLTHANVIIRESRLKKGSLYSQKTILSARENIQRLGFFKSVSEPEILFQGDKAFITFTVEEGNPNSLDGVVGYNPPASEKDAGYFTGRIQFSFKNLLGTGRHLEAYWEKKDQYSQAMRFGYEEPWLIGWPFHLGGWFEQEIRDTTYIERNWRLSAKYFPWPSLSINISGGRKEILPDSLGSILYQLHRSKAWILEAGFLYNTLDDPLNPKKGVRYSTSAALGRKNNLTSVSGYEDSSFSVVNTREIRMQAEILLPAFKRQVLYLCINGMEIKTGDRFVPFSEQIRFGGSKTVRGYAEDFFRGNLVAWMNIEYRYLLSSRSRAFVFFDAGSFQRKEETGTIRGTKIGYGFGIRIDTRLGLFGVDYGLGEGDSPLNGKIHVGLVNRF